MRAILHKGGILLLIAVVFSIGCGKDDESSGLLFPSATFESIKEAPQEIALGDQEYVLGTYLWRDFMPISPPEGKPLIALIRVIEKNGDPIAADLQLKYLWIVYGRDIWFTTFTDETPPSPENELQRIARNGPLWGPEVKVDVIVGLRRGNGAIELLGAPDQWIYRTE